MIKTYSGLSPEPKEILRYAGVFGKDPFAAALLSEVCKEMGQAGSGKVCWCKLPVETEGDFCDFEAFSLHSYDLAKNLQGCKEVLLFGATAGVEWDRKILRYSALSPAKAMMVQAMGAAVVECLCDTFCKEMEAEEGPLRPRFSAGYGDLSLSAQKEIFRVLDCNKIGLSLNESLLMSPTKSVTAFVGIGRKK